MFRKKKNTDYLDKIRISQLEELNKRAEEMETRERSLRTVLSLLKSADNRLVRMGSCYSYTVREALEAIKIDIADSSKELDELNRLINEE